MTTTAGAPDANAPCAPTRSPGGAAGWPRMCCVMSRPSIPGPGCSEPRWPRRSAWPPPPSTCWPTRVASGPPRPARHEPARCGSVHQEHLPDRGRRRGGHRLRRRMVVPGVYHARPSRHGQHRSSGRHSRRERRDSGDGVISAADLEVNTGPLADLSSAEQAADLTFADIGWLSDISGGLPVVVKGVLRGDDALADVAGLSAAGLAVAAVPR